MPWSNALQARGEDNLPYLLGPAARLVLDHDQLHPIAREALDASGALESIRRNPYRSIVARAIELVQATADAIDIVDAYVPPERAAVPWQARPGTAAQFGAFLSSDIATFAKAIKEAGVQLED